MKRRWSQTQEYGQLGIIESVSLRNFMCHDNLSFDFDPHMNFIVGRNGSGKSAVLTGIILALGGKSGATGRYSNIKGFVKTGKNSASVAVTLKNCGPEAYKPEEFGKKITIERHFTADGVSSYKLKSELGRIISTSKEELTNILTVMDIQIENPITVLTQDISRSFLVSKNSKADKLFQLFYRGTGLAKVHEDYNRALQQKEEAKAELQNKKSVLPEMEKDIKKLKSLLDKSSKVAELKKELFWAMVIEFEKKRDESQEALDKVKKDYSDFKEKLDRCEAELASISQSVASVHTERKESDEKMNAIRKDIGELNEKKADLSSEIRQVQGAYSSHEREVKKFTSEIESIESIINDIKMKNENELNEDKLKHEMKVNNLKTEMSNTSSQIRQLETQMHTLRESLAFMQNKMDICHAEIQEIKYEKDIIVKERRLLIEGLTNRINLFGPEMVNVLREVQNANRNGVFKIQPKGPIGLYIKVKNPDWNFAVQECLKSNFLKTFLCDNHYDAEQLTRIFNKYYQRTRPSIITTKFVSQVYDVSAHKTVCEHPTLLDMLDIEDPVITNCLIDQKQIENILLIADQSQALDLMLHNPPQKCRFAYTPNGDQYCHSPYRNYSCRNMNQICMLKTLNDDDVRKKDEQLKEKDQFIAEKMSDKDNLIIQTKQNEQEINRIDNKMTELNTKWKSASMQLKAIGIYEEPRDINCLESDLEQLLKEKQYHKEQRSNCKDSLDSKNEELKSLEKNTDDLKRVLQVESRNYSKLADKIQEYESRKERLETTIKKINEQLKRMEPVLEEREKGLSNDNATVETATNNAIDAGPRINTRRSSDTIRQILKETEKFVQKQKNCDRQTLLAEYEEKVQNLNKAKSELERQEKINLRLDQMMAKRFEEFQKICKNTSVSLTCHFTALLKENNFSGYPDVNFEDKSLEIYAKPEKTSTKLGSKPNLAQLSGGERSYVTIAFLLSLWDRIRMPFRILDEYDVFMDSNNRHLSIHLLVNTAKANRNVQYIFLSPLELPQIEDSDHVKVHKMPAPRK